MTRAAAKPPVLPIDDPRYIAGVRDALEDLRHHLLGLERDLADVIEGVHPDRRESARNFVHYVAMRQHDIRDLQKRLTRLGLSSLGRAEAAVLFSINSVDRAASRLADSSWQPPPDFVRARIDLDAGHDLLDRHTDALLGPRPSDRTVRVMVTMPSAAATDPTFVRGCLDRGMDLMRINCAHDGPEQWLAMVEHLREAERNGARRCRVLFDIAGPKIRTSRLIDRVGQPAESIRLRMGEEFFLATEDEARRVADATPGLAVVACSAPMALAACETGAPVWFDDGRIGAKVTRSGDVTLGLRVVHARPGGSRLKLDKGINFPGTHIDLPAVTDHDWADIETVLPHADVLGLSFVREVEHIERVQRRLAELADHPVGLVLKVETREAFDHLPELLLALMRSPASGVMIARGDLAVECGYERLAEVQEEIMWLCEASHTPVIWATQVLETLAKKGVPTRSEVTDAAMAQRAECVMLNKGPYILRAVEFLDDILRRMESHQRKKTPHLKMLGVAERFRQKR